MKYVLNYLFKVCKMKEDIGKDTLDLTNNDNKSDESIGSIETFFIMKAISEAKELKNLILTGIIIAY